LKLDQHISDLLFRYDCVIVPDFGGFLANYQAAKINSRTHTFTPPGKKVSFNKNLSSNDGLLANHIVQEYGVTYENALLSIRNCVNDYQAELQKGKRILIENVGVLYLDATKSILFEPISTVNFLSDAFGLEKFHATPIKEETKVRKITKISTGKSIHPGRIAAAIAIPLFFIGSAMFYQGKISNETSPIQLSNLGYNKAESVYSMRMEEPTFSSEELDDESFNTIIKSAESRSFALIDAVETEENWFIVGGCFSEESNAKSFVKKLKKQGYPAKQIDHFKELHAVAYAGFANESDAREFLASVKTKSNKSAWLLKAN
jgi:hypothetical protein